VSRLIAFRLDFQRLKPSMTADPSSGLGPRTDGKGRQLWGAGHGLALCQWLELARWLYPHLSIPEQSRYLRQRTMRARKPRRAVP